MTTAAVPSPATERQQTQALAQKDAFNNVRALLERSKDNIKLALPKHIGPEFMIRVALTSVQRTPELLECHPITLIGAVMQAAQLGLVPDGVLGLAYLVPYKNRKKNRKEVQFIPGYKGLIALARRSGEVSTIGAEVVREKDAFKYTLGLNPVLEHTPTDDENPGAIKRVYAFARLKDGGYQLVVLNMRQVNAIKARSQSAGSEYSPWNTDPEWMIKKTAIRQLCKLLPASTELQRAIALDERAEIGLPQDLSILADETETPTPDEPTDAADGDQRDPLDEELGSLDGDMQQKFRVVFSDLDLTGGQALAELRRYKGKEAELLTKLQAQVYEKLRSGNGKPNGNGHAEQKTTTAPPATASKPAPAGKWHI